MYDVDFDIFYSFSAIFAFTISASRTSHVKYDPFVGANELFD